MKRLIKWALGHLPRPLMQRLAGWMVPVVGLFMRGSRYRCPLCGHTFRRMLPYGYVVQRSNALCPSCLSLERHRLLWLWLQHETELFEKRPTLLHIAPEVCLMRHLKRLYRTDPERYQTADLESPLADLHFDIQQIPLPDCRFEMVICNHLLEHVESDYQALKELHRILQPGGWGVILSPVDYALEKTFEDDTITDPEERTRIFGQYDHRRNYGRDFVERLREAGFEAEEIDYAARLSEEERQCYALATDRIYRIRRPN